MNWTKEQMAANGLKEVRPGVFERTDDFLGKDYVDCRPQPQPTSIAKSKSKTTPLGVTTDEAKLNKLERDFLVILRNLERNGTIRNVGIQCLTLKLANDCRYNPDFIAFSKDFRMICFETKGAFAREDSIIKLKVAARKFPEIKFFFVTRENGEWKQEVVKS